MPRFKDIVGLILLALLVTIPLFFLFNNGLDKQGDRIILKEKK